MRQKKRVLRGSVIFKNPHICKPVFYPKRPESVNGNSGRSLTFAPNKSAAQVSQSVESWLTDFSIFLPFSIWRAAMLLKYHGQFQNCWLRLT